MTRRCIPFLLLGLYPAAGLAGVKTYTGEGEGCWRAGSAVYAHVASVIDIAPGRLRLTLHISATLAGSYDAAAAPVLKADVYYGIASAVRKRPSANTRVVVILWRSGDAQGRALDRWVIPTAFMAFMPNQAPILTVESFEDPQVQDVISRLRQLRAPRKNGQKN